MFIKCKENDKTQGIYNGMPAIFITYYIENMEMFESLNFTSFLTNMTEYYRNMKVLMKKKKTSSRAAEKKKKNNKDAVDEYEIDVDVDDLDKQFEEEEKIRESSKMCLTTFTTHVDVPNYHVLSKNISMIIFNLKTRQLNKIKPIIKYTCEECCAAAHHAPNYYATNQQQQQSCRLHQEPAVQFLHFNWILNYSQTIYNVQGATLKTDEIYLTSHVLKSNLLRTLYVIISRCSSPKQIITDIDMIKQILRIVYNCDIRVMNSFLKKENITIRANSFI